jgi:LacI family transcriptional regulator
MTKKSKHATLSEVAKKAGVGTTTVSRVINGGRSVDPKTLAKVERAIQSLGYVPNHAARILKGGRTRTIGFVIPSIADPFFSSCAEAAQAVARDNDSLLIVLTTQNDPKTEMDAVNVLLRHRVDGFMIAPADSGGGLLRELLGRVSIPVVAFDRPVTDSSVPSVLADNYAGAQLATRHLIEHGCKRIVCLTGESNLYTIQERLRGYRDAIESAGLECLIDSSIGDYDSAELALEKLFGHSKPPDGIFTLKNSVTIETFAVLQKHNILIPDAVALLGYDDFQLAETLRPSISVIRQPIEAIGKMAAELLFRRLSDAPAPTRRGQQVRPEQVQLRTRLVQRRSCGCLTASA